MSQRITLIKATIRMEGRWAVGKIALAGSEVDLPVAVDPRSPTALGHRPFIPGGSLAGSLRRHLEGDAEGLLGPEPPEWEVSSRADRKASPLAIRGTVVLDGLEIADRSSTSIDIKRGAAREHTSRSEQYVLPGRFVVAMDMRGQAPAGLGAKLATWRPILGRGRSTGLGSGVVESVEVLDIDLGDPAQLTWWLTSRNDWYAGAAEPPHEPDRLEPGTASDGAEGGSAEGHGEVNELIVELSTTEPLHVGNGDNDTQQDGHRAIGVLRQDGQVLVPGSSWKGIFRHRAETILGLVASPDQSDAVGAIVDVVFGSAKARGLLAFSDSLAAKKAPEITRTHVAIDRFTGGVIDGGLYRVVALDAGAKLTLHIKGVGEPASPVGNLIRHVVRDLHDGLVSVGGMGTRGYGRLKVGGSTVLQGLAPIDVTALLESVSVGEAKGESDGQA